MRVRIKAIDYLKCVACLLIINSHIADLYPEKLKVLSWGGYFGNSIFFFVSGFCLLGIDTSFTLWYWKRFVRVYTPFLLSVPFLLADNRFTADGIEMLMPFKLYHFIPTILILYIPFYFAVILDKRGIKFTYLSLFLLIVSCSYFYICYDYNNKNIYEHFSFLEMISYFASMLLGASVKKNGHGKTGFSLCIAVICFILYAYQNIFHFPKSISILQLLLGIGFAYGAGSFMIGIEEKLPFNWVINRISTVTLEAYIVHYICIDAYKAIGFPTNIVFFLISVIAVASCLHWLSNKLIEKIPEILRRKI